jgi:hypothetical protein
VKKKKKRRGGGRRRGGRGRRKRRRRTTTTTTTTTTLNNTLHAEQLQRIKVPCTKSQRNGNRIRVTSVVSMLSGVLVSCYLHTHLPVIYTPTFLLSTHPPSYQNNDSRGWQNFILRL